MITILHPLPLNNSIYVGGIETWILDFLDFSKGDYRLIGCSRGKYGETYNFRSGVEKFSITELPVRRKYVPDSLKFVCAIFKKSKLLTNKIIIHRIEFLIPLRMLRPKSEITLFIHTDSKAQTNKGSDSLWRYLPFLYFFFESLSLLFADQVFVYSQSDFLRISRKFPSAQRLLSWYNPLIFKNFELERLTQVIWAGRFEDVKDPFLAIEAFALLPHKKGVRMLLVGEGSLFEEVRAYSEVLDPQNPIEFLGGIPQELLSEVLNKSKVFLQTSRFEGSPRILLEALACGVKIVSTKGGDPDLWSTKIEGSKLSESRDPSHIALLLSEALIESTTTSVGSEKLIRSRSAVKEVHRIEQKVFS